MAIKLDKVYPWIKQVENIQTGGIINVAAADGTQAEVSLPWHLWLGDLGVFYVVDEGESFQMVQAAMLPEGMDESALFERACDNLLRDIEFRICSTNWGGAGIVCGGNFEAASLCCPGIWAFVAQQYQEDFIVAAPARDVVILAPASDPNRVHNLKVTVNQILCGGDHALSNRLFLYSVDNGTFSVMGEAAFPFWDAPNTAAFMCSHVLNEEKPILYVSHDEDGYWQFLCGGTHTEDDAKVVSLMSAWKHDESIGQLASMPCGSVAQRLDIHSEWRIKYAKDSSLIYREHI